ncbi:hypothetical protein B296_00031331 [Ensete ventricosum]|uniref:Uncharacterized protein n=1 Tax=Ensete ventricosum TaxID=4639 RepID=A0A426X974_ENSVE|nr:hypothetical protein B296_00031331 [Ensete ventricosum]
MALMDQVHDISRVITSLDNKSEILRVEIQKLKDGGNRDMVASVDQRAAEAQALADNLKVELEEAIQERESHDKELSGVQGTLSELQGQLAKAQGHFDDLWGQLANAWERLADSEGQLYNVMA